MAVVRSIFRELKKKVKTDKNFYETIAYTLGPKDAKAIQKAFIESKSVFNPNRKDKSQCSMIEQLCYKYSKEVKEQFFSDPKLRLVFNLYM